ncbi:3,4-dihydroxy-2-butanone-4-phosphate synthase [Pseudomonas sp. SBB6]|uniref:3,4-dihydroxy-2-butanone-4-phosphate synthase n=1 Tax=Pseudomonas sp. SBB6 TaxID=2962032 RepID=UPI0020B72A80|nr:3,4-dihydroxy-2-butanone-4-phosphate synthase [Pseudomonas sp. SBB6]MCP3751412.1 3,4-dihydroxy-2-butanone-4-phosphate synthase [Pseudomonas sp. SBB6]
MPFNSIEDILEDYRQGKMVLLVDDEDRGLICLTLTDEHCQRLGLEQMVPANGSAFSTAFTVSIEAARGVTTGISAADRACGVLTRAGHTEAGCDLARLAGFSPASVIVEVLNGDGSMARRPDLVGAEYTGPANWTLWAALQKVADEGCGVVVILANHESSQALLERVPHLTQPPRPYPRGQSRSYSQVGTGAQILQDLGVGKLRHLGPPLKYAGLTGYNLEVVQSIPFSAAL